jgi:hypothetical protein
MGGVLLLNLALVLPAAAAACCLRVTHLSQLNCVMYLIDQRTAETLAAEACFVPKGLCAGPTYLQLLPDTAAAAADAEGLGVWLSGSPLSNLINLRLCT